ncbi:MAG: 50S ribosomal protein L10 [Myxococcales bacterium]|nr:50S ribosomal protein L10 [Myxococcales bacterium]
MSLTRQAKEDAVAALVERLGRAKGGIVAGFSGLNVAAVSQIRRKFREVNAEYKVVKNTLMKRAIAGTSIEPLGKWFQGRPRSPSSTTTSSRRWARWSKT